ncbi:MAG: GAF domain-containing protein [Deltaproteobacteria bacterium]|nr:GAF domain-containing protein [Deltaproteobacteria bacterium]
MATNAAKEKPTVDNNALQAENEALEGALELTRRRLAAMRQVAMALAGRLDLDQLLRQMMNSVKEITDCDRASLFIVDEARDELWSRVAQGIDEDDDDKVENEDHASTSYGTLRMPRSSGIAGYVSRSGVLLKIDDAYQDARFNKDVDHATGYTTKSILCAPILNAHGEPIGVVQALNKKNGPFSVEDERLLEAISHQLSVALTDALLFEELKERAHSLEEARSDLSKRMRELDLLVEVEREMAETFSTEELLNVITKKLHSVMDADAASTALVDRATGGIQFHAATGEAASAVTGLTLPSTVGIIGAAIQKGEAVVVEDAAKDKRHDAALAAEVGFEPGPVIAIPLKSDERSLGAVEVMRKKGRAGFNEDDLRLLSLIAARVAASVAANLQRQKSRHEEQLLTIGHMLSGIVHDFKTPMTVISGYVQLMSMTDEEEEREEAASIVLKQTGLMASMTKELLQFARGETEIYIRKVYVNHFLRDVTDMLNPLFAKYDDIQLVVDATYQGTLRCDESKLKRALVNLARNSLEAMEESGGTCTLTVLQLGDQVEFAVCDEGKGLLPEIEGRLFESFATHGKEDGTGLGLALVKKIMRDHHGDIRVENEPGKGVTFRLRLPL